MNYLGLDWGKNKIGVAIGSSETKTAVPLEIIKFENIEQVFARLAKIIFEENIGTIVIGAPTKKELALDLKNFIGELSARFSLPVHIVDEKVTTKMASGLLGKTKKNEDSVAAMIILQNFIDREQYGRNREN
jgi:putative Holliday junction resolvase